MTFQTVSIDPSTILKFRKFSLFPPKNIPSKERGNRRGSFRYDIKVNIVAVGEYNRKKNLINQIKMKRERGKNPLNPLRAD